MEQQKMSSTQAPLITLRMKSSRSTPPSERRGVDNIDEMADQIGVMMEQEASKAYKIRDYLTRRKAEKKSIDIDSVCREKMCDWSYRVVDHFHASREIVAIAFNYLDRFVDRCCCDRTAFKLAAMTSVYMATKIFNSREISLASLAQLSRGEFDVAHISEMEGIILQTLDWRMQPPTIQCFINTLHSFLPVAPCMATREIYSRAIFFGELALFDASFITQPRSAIAIAALLNAMEGTDEIKISKVDQNKFMTAVRELCGVRFSEQAITAIRNRLWYIYSQSAQYKEDAAPLSCAASATSQDAPVKKDLLGGDQSPVCVTVVSTQQ